MSFREKVSNLSLNKILAVNFLSNFCWTFYRYTAQRAQRSLGWDLQCNKCNQLQARFVVGFVVGNALSSPACRAYQWTTRPLLRYVPVVGQLKPFKGASTTGSLLRFKGFRSAREDQSLSLIGGLRSHVHYCLIVLADTAYVLEGSRLSLRTSAYDIQYASPLTGCRAYRK